MEDEGTAFGAETFGVFLVVWMECRKVLGFCFLVFEFVHLLRAIILAMIDLRFMLAMIDLCIRLAMIDL